MFFFLSLLLILFQKQFCCNCPPPGHLEEVTDSQSEGNADREEGTVDGKNERNDKTKMNKWRLQKDQKRREINGKRGQMMESVCYAPSLFLFLSDSDMSI